MADLLKIGEEKAKTDPLQAASLCQGIIQETEEHMAEVNGYIEEFDQHRKLLENIKAEFNQSLD